MIIDSIDVSIVVPVFNESENIADTVERLLVTFASRPERVEIVVVNDGCTDDTLAVAQRLAEHEPRLTVTGYAKNVGRGRALRVGFGVAKGKFIVSIDADLSYDPVYILDLLDALYASPEVDFVLGSPYMPGGGTEGVAADRLFISRLGNWVLRTLVYQDIYTFTGIFRAYRREVLDALELEADDKELHLEILSRALAAGYRLKEVPAILRNRRKGTSKFRFRGTAISHLLFSFYERPMVVFGLIGIILLVSGLLSGGYVTMLRFQGTLNPVRPLVTFTAILFLSGLQILAFGFIALQIGILRRELYKIQRENRLLARQIQQILIEKK